RPVRIFDQHATGGAFYAPNLPGGIAEQDDVATIAFHGEVFINGADYGAFWFCNDGVKRIFRNSATAGDGREARPPPAPQPPVDPITIQVNPVTATPSGNAVRKHGEHFVEFGTRQVAVGVSATHQLE